jgi:non-specific protein-tyrosine kinase
LELRAYLTILRRWWWLLLLGAILGGGSGYLASRYQTPLYQAKTTLMIGRFTQSINPSSSELNTIQRLAQSYAEMARREPVLRAAAESLEPEMDWAGLQDKVQAKPILDTQLMEISVEDTDPHRAKRIADEITRQLILQSPTTTVNEDQEAYRAFVKDQLADLQQKIIAAQQKLPELEAALDLETTAEGVRRRQDEIDGLQAKLSTWQSNYASLLGFVQESEEGINFLTVIEPATLPAQPANASLERDVLLAMMVGLILSAGLVFLLEYLDDTIKTTDDVRRVLGLTALGTIPKIEPLRQNGRSQGQMVAVQETASSPTAEAYRTLRTNVQFSTLIMTRSANTLLVTSSGAGEGKSTTAANLAVVMAHAGKRVIVVDTDLRRPILHKLFGVSNEVGLTDLLVNKTLTLEAVMAKTAIDNLQVLPSGPLPPNAADFLSSEQMEGLIAHLTEQADMVIFDSPPLLVVTDARILATRLGATLLVIEAGRTRSEVCRRGVEVLEQVGVNPLGVVLNRFNPKQDAGYYGYYNYYYYTDNGNSRGPRKRR